VRAHRIVKVKGKVAVAVSGGKDSILALRLMHDVLSPVKGLELVAITIDEGIRGYRSSSLKIARKVADDLGVEWVKVMFRDLYGSDLDKMLRRTELGPCTVCGILRRKALNSAASREGCSLLATGHNLDDMAQTVLMNVMSADIARFSRLGPHHDTLPGLVPRAMPLRTTPETETHLSSYLLGLPIHDRECPYSDAARRGFFRDMVLRAEEEIPGTRHSLLRFHEAVAGMSHGGRPVPTPCRKCGEPVFDAEAPAKCKACSLLESMGMEGSDEAEAP